MSPPEAHNPEPQTWRYQERAIMICRIPANNHSQFQCFSNFHLLITSARGEAGWPQLTRRREKCFGILWLSCLNLPIFNALQVIKRIRGSHWLSPELESFSHRISAQTSSLRSQSHQFPQGHAGLDPLDLGDVKTLETREKTVLMPKAGETEVMFAECQTGILEIVQAGEMCWFFSEFFCHGHHFNTAVISFVLLWGAATS